MSGNVFDDTVRVSKPNAVATAMRVCDMLDNDIGVKSVVIGSAGRKETSGDIDVAIKTDLPPQELASRYCQYQAKILPGGRIVSLRYPVYGNSGDFVQVDLMITNNIEFAQWMYFAPSKEESKYDGRYRNILFSAISSTVYRLPIDFNDGSVEVTWRRFALNYNTGLWRVTTTIQGKKGFVQEKPVGDKRFVTDDPDKIIDCLFGNPGLLGKDVMTFEQAWEAFNSYEFRHETLRYAIKQKFLAALDKINLPWPELT